MNSFDENDLIAYQLHELSPLRERAIRRALKLNPELAAELEGIAAMLRAFSSPEALPLVDAEAMERSWERVRPSLAVLTPKTALWRWGWEVAVGSGLAAAAVAAVVLMHPQAGPAVTTASLDGGVSASPFPVGEDTAEAGVRRGYPAPQRYNNRPGPLTTAPVNMGTSDAVIFLPLAENDGQGSASIAPAPRLFEIKQEGPLPPLPAAPLPQRQRVETSVSLGGFGQLTAPRLSDGSAGFVTQSLTPSAGVLGTFQQSFRPWLGYSVNMGYTRGSEHNTNNAGVGSAGAAADYSIANNVYELSLSYLAKTRLTKKLTGFADVGAGMMTFLPEHRGADAINYVPAHYRSLVPSVNFRPLGVGGVGVDYHLNAKLALRAEYRAQVYKYADYGTGLPKLTTVTSEPTVSLVYNFGGKKH